MKLSLITLAFVFGRAVALEPACTYGILPIGVEMDPNNEYDCAVCDTGRDCVDLITGLPCDDKPAEPSAKPSATPSTDPSATPSANPTATPTGQGERSPSETPSEVPSVKPSANPSATPSAEPTGQGERSPSETPSEVPSKSPTKSPTSSCPELAPGTEQHVTLPGAGPQNDYNGFIPKDTSALCQSGNGYRCNGFKTKNDCSGTPQNEFYNPGDWFAVAKGDYMYCQMPNNDIVCFEVDHVDHKEGNELIEYHLTLGCSDPSKIAASCNPVDGYAFTDFVMKNKDTEYYSWDEGYSTKGTFITADEGRRGLSHSSACLGKPCV